MATRRDWSRTREFEDIEEGLFQGPTGVDQEYGSRMSSLVREFTRMAASDREFLRVLLDSGGEIDRGSPQTPYTSELRYMGSFFTPESELYHNPGCILLTPSQAPPDSVFGQRPAHRSNPAPVLHGPLSPADAVFAHRPPGYNPTAVPQTLFPLPADSGYSHRRDPSYNHPPLPQVPAPPASGFPSPVPPKLGFFSGQGHKNEASYPQWRSGVESVVKTGIYQEAMVITNIRRSLRGRAADVGHEVRGHMSNWCYPWAVFHCKTSP